MGFDVKRELGTFITYFLFALAAELAGFVGWINELQKGGDMFQLSAAFHAYELSRLPAWLLVFVSLSFFRLLIMFLVFRIGLKSVKQW